MAVGGASEREAYVGAEGFLLSRRGRAPSDWSNEEDEEFDGGGPFFVRRLEVD